MNPILQRAREARAAALAAIEAVTSAAEARGGELRNLTTEEEALVEGHMATVRAAIKTIATQEEFDEARKAAVGHGPTASPAVIVSEPSVYRKNGKHSIFRDMLKAREGDFDARDRLNRHERSIGDEYEVLKETRGRNFVNPFDGSRGTEERATGSASAGSFAPPVFLIDQFVPEAVAGRTIADRLTHGDLPEGISSIHLPKVTVGSVVDTNAEDATLAEQDTVATDLVATVATIGGESRVTQKLLDTSPGTILDEELMRNLTRHYNQRIDRFALAALVAAGTVVAYTDATPTLPELQEAMARAASQIAKVPGLRASDSVLHPSIWYWLTGQKDTAGRPFITPNNGGPNNAYGTNLGPVTDGDPVGDFSSLRAWMDANLPTNLGAGTNESEILVADFSQSILWEGSLRMRVLPTTDGKINNLFQLWSYAACMADRYPAATSVIGGTGLIVQAGY